MKIREVRTRRIELIELHARHNADNDDAVGRHQREALDIQSDTIKVREEVLEEVRRIIPTKGAILPAREQDGRRDRRRLSPVARRWWTS